MDINDEMKGPCSHNSTTVLPFICGELNQRFDANCGADLLIMIAKYKMRIWYYSAGMFESLTCLKMIVSEIKFSTVQLEQFPSKC